MLNVNIDRADPASLHEQVTGQIRRAIADGEAAPGERLPLAKDLAAVLGVNKNTVQRHLNAGHTTRALGYPLRDGARRRAHPLSVKHPQCAALADGLMTPLLPEGTRYDRDQLVPSQCRISVSVVPVMLLT